MLQAAPSFEHPYLLARCDQSLPTTFSKGSYPDPLSASANFKVGLVCSGSFRFPGLFLAQQPSKLALFVLAFSVLLSFF